MHNPKYAIATIDKTGAHVLLHVPDDGQFTMDEIKEEVIEQYGYKHPLIGLPTMNKPVPELEVA